MKLRVEKKHRAAYGGNQPRQIGPKGEPNGRHLRYVVVEGKPDTYKMIHATRKPLKRRVLG